MLNYFKELYAFIMLSIVFLLTVILGFICGFPLCLFGHTDIWYENVVKYFASMSEKMRPFAPQIFTQVHYNSVVNKQK